MKPKSLPLFLLVFFLAGCTSHVYYEVMIDPSLSNYEECAFSAGFGSGWRGEQIFSNCIENWQRTGYKTPEELTAAEKDELRLPGPDELILTSKVAKPDVYMVHPASGKAKKCITGAQCVRQFSAHGYKRAENLTVEDQRPENVIALVHLKSGHVMYCAHQFPSGVSVANRVSVEVEYSTKCAEQFQLLGYKKAENLTAEEWARLR